MVSGCLVAKNQLNVAFDAKIFILVWLMGVLEVWYIPQWVDHWIPSISHNKTARIYMVNNVVSQAASQEIAEEALSKSTLRLLNPVFLLCTPHNALCHIENPLQVVCANTKICLLVDVYPLATVQRRMKQIDSDICYLCDLGETEDREHFLIRCDTLKEVRAKYLHRILDLIPHIDNLNTENPDQFLVPDTGRLLYHKKKKKTLPVFGSCLGHVQKFQVTWG